MIKITIELWPYGDSSKKKVIAEGIIYNDGTGTYEIGNYKSEFYDGARTEFTTRKIGSADVSNWQRKKSIWQLLKECLCCLEKNNG